MTISEQIKIHRKELGFTQEQIANLLGVSTPAVNKWEKGLSFPDITLLPSLARLLKIDMNTLFSFHENLSEMEIGILIDKIADTALNESIDSAFEIADRKIRDYPHCDAFIYSAATTLDASLTLSVKGTTKKEEYQTKILQWYKKAAGSADNKIKYPAIYMLITKYINQSDYDKAEQLMEKIPDLNIDKTMLQANILMHKNELDTAGELLERNLLQTLSHLQSYLYHLIEIEEKTGNPKEAEAIAEITAKMISLFDLWKYGAIVPHLQTAVFEKNVNKSLSLIQSILQVVKEPWDIKKSPLYYRFGTKQGFENIGDSFNHAFIEELKTSEEYDFLRNNEEFSNILATYRQNPDD